MTKVQNHNKGRTIISFITIFVNEENFNFIIIQFVKNIFRSYSVLVLKILIVLVLVLVNEVVIIFVLVFVHCLFVRSNIRFFTVINPLLRS